MLSTVVPAGTVGGSVSITAKVDLAEAILGMVLGLANIATEIIRMAVIIAAKPYLVVHFLLIFHQNRIGEN